MISAKICKDTGRALEFSNDDPAPEGFTLVEISDAHRLKAGAVWIAGLVLDPPETAAALELLAAENFAADPAAEKAERRAALESNLAAALESAADLQALIEELDKAAEE